MVELFDKVEILVGYRESETGIIASISEMGFNTVCVVQFDNGETHAYDSDDLMPYEDDNE